MCGRRSTPRRCSTVCGDGRRRHAAGRRPRDRPLRRAARDLHRARVRDAATGGWRTRHMASTSSLPPATPVYAPLDGVVERQREPRQPRRLRRRRAARPRDADGVTFWTLHGHLDPRVARRPARSAARARRSRRPRRAGGQRRLGAAPAPAAVTPTWRRRDLHGVGALARRPTCAAASAPIPNLLLGLPGGVARRAAAAGHRPRAARRLMSRALSLAYREPLHIVRGEGAYLYDDARRAYLDLVNNVAHVGHCHPRVVAAGARQMARAEHEHALPARLGHRLRAPAGRDAARPAARRASS